MSIDKIRKPMTTEDREEIKQTEARWFGMDNHCMPKEFHGMVYLFQTKKELDDLLSQAEARGRESVIRMVEDMWVDLEGYSPIQQDEITKYLLTKIKGEHGDNN